MNLNSKQVLISAVLAGFLVSCGSSDNHTENKESKTVSVERGPVINAIVKDSSGQLAKGDGKTNKYVFDKKIQYPVIVTSGQNTFVDVDGDGVQTSNVDFKLGEIKLQSCQENITTISTYAFNQANDCSKVDEVYSNISKNTGISQEELKKLPSQQAKGSDSLILSNLIFTKLYKKTDLKNVNVDTLNNDLKILKDELGTQIQGKSSSEIEKIFVKKDNVETIKDVVEPVVGNLNKIELKDTQKFNVKKVVSGELSDYHEIGDTRIVSSDIIDGNKILIANKWHNSLNVINLATNDIKVNPIAASKTAGHNKTDASTGASESEINKVEYANNFAFINVYYNEDESSMDKDDKIVGIHKVPVNNDGTLDISKVTKTKDGENYKDFIVSNQANVVMAYDGTYLKTFLGGLTNEKSSNELELKAMAISNDDIPLVVFKENSKVYLSATAHKANNKDIELNFEPTKIIPAGTKVIALVEKTNKALQIATIDLNAKKVGNLVSINEIDGKSSYDVSPNGKFLVVGSKSSVSIVELYSGNFNVLASKEVGDARISAKFLSDNKVSYTKGNAEVEVLSFEETSDKLTQSDLIALKLQKIDNCVINNCLAYTEVRKDMDFSTTKILNDSLSVKYEPTGAIAQYLAADGKFTKPDVTTTGKLKIIGTQGSNQGERVIDLTLIGKDLKDTLVIENESIINTIVFGDKIVVATTKGLRTYSANGNKLEQVGDLVKLNGIDEIAPYGTFTNTVIHKINDNTIIGLGIKYTGDSVKSKSRGKDVDIKLYDTKIFKATVDANGVNPNVEFIDVQGGDIMNIDVSEDKKTLGVLFYPSPKFVDDTKNPGYKTSGKSSSSALLYDLTSNSIKTPKFDLIREASDTHPEEVISLNADASKLVVGDTHHGVLKVYESNGHKYKSFGAENFTGKLNHMSSTFFAGDKIIATPFKNSSFFALSLDETLTPISYPDGKGWYSKAFVEGSKVYFATSSRYAQGRVGLTQYDVSTNTTQDKEYKMFKGTTIIDLVDVDFLGTKVILTGYKEKDGYINIQDK